MMYGGTFKFPALEAHWPSCHHHSSPSALPRKERFPTPNRKLTDKLVGLLDNWSCLFCRGSCSDDGHALPPSLLTAILIALTQFQFSPPKHTASPHLFHTGDCLPLLSGHHAQRNGPDSF